MVNEHFSHLLPQQQISDERIWETTRFCIADGAASNVSAALMLGGAEVGRAYNLTHAVGVFDQRMIRIYRRLAWLPQVIGSSAPSTSPVSVGLWQFSEETRLALAIRAGVPKALSRDWFSSSREGKSLAA